MTDTEKLKIIDHNLEEIALELKTSENAILVTKPMSYEQAKKLVKEKLGVELSPKAYNLILEIGGYIE